MARETPQASSEAKHTVTMSHTTRTTSTTTRCTTDYSDRPGGVDFSKGWEGWGEETETVVESRETQSQNKTDRTVPTRDSRLSCGHFFSSDDGGTFQFGSRTDPDHVALGLSKICEPSTANIRTDIICEETNPKSRYLSIFMKPWADTKEYKLGGELLQCPVGSGVQTGVFKTRAYPAWLPELTTSRIRLMDSIEEPKVVLWLKKLEMSCKHNWRINVTASDISSRGFQLYICTWGGSCVLGTKITWIAYSGKLKEEILSGVVGGGMPGSVRQEKSFGGITSLPYRCSEKKGKQRDILLALSGLEIDAHGSSSGGIEMEWDIAKWKNRTYEAQETGV